MSAARGSDFDVDLRGGPRGEGPGEEGALPLTLQDALRLKGFCGAAFGTAEKATPKDKRSSAKIPTFCQKSANTIAETLALKFCSKKPEWRIYGISADS